MPDPFAVRPPRPRSKSMGDFPLMAKRLALKQLPALPRYNEHGLPPRQADLQARRVTADTPESRAVCALQMNGEARERIGKFATVIDGRGKSVHPPRPQELSAAQVQALLRDMLPQLPEGSAQRLATLDLSPVTGLFVAGTLRRDDRETIGPGSSQLRFEAAFKLTPAGRERLASYYARKYGADITFSTATMDDAFAPDAGFVERCRQQPGKVVRSALYMGHPADRHGQLLVYLRESGREALLWFDSMANVSNLGEGVDLARAVAPLARDGKPVEVFQNIRKIQRDYASCWVFAMKTAATLTGRKPDGRGGFKDYLAPNLIQRLDAKRLHTPVPEGANPVWALPEVVKASQLLESVLADAGEDLDMQLEGAKPGVTLRFFLEKYTYTNEDGIKVLDYARQKGHRAAELAAIETWIQRIGDKLGKEVWTIERQNTFARSMKALVRKHQELSVEDNIKELHSRMNDPAALIWQGLKAQSQIALEIGIIKSMRAPTPRQVEIHIHKVIGLLRGLGEELSRCFGAYASTSMPIGVQKFSQQIMPQLHASMDEMQAMLVTVASAPQGLAGGSANPAIRA